MVAIYKMKKQMLVIGVYYQKLTYYSHVISIETDLQYFQFFDLIKTVYGSLQGFRNNKNSSPRLMWKH